MRAKDSGRELDPVLVLAQGSNAAGQPISRAGARDFGPSPVRLERNWLGANFLLYVSSPGYAWGRIELDVAAGGERFVELGRGGDLDVILAGKTAAPGAWLRLYGPDSWLVLETALGDGGSTTSIEGLAPGSLRVRAEVGNWWDTPLLELGEAAAEVTAGARTSVRLAFETPAPVERVPLAGVLKLPAEWKLGKFALVFDLLDAALDGTQGSFSIESSTMGTHAQEPDAFRWTAGAVQPGHYDVALEEATFHVVLSVPASGLSDARIEVPPPCEVALRCVDEGTGAEVTVERVNWASALPVGVRVSMRRMARWDESARRWRFQAPLGGIDVHTSGDGYEGDAKADLHAGWNELELRVLRVSGLTLILRDGALTIPWDNRARPALEPAEGQTERTSRRMTSGNGRFTLLARAPGRYTLRIPPIAGYEPVPDEVVGIEKGVIAEHVIELRRKP